MPDYNVKYNELMHGSDPEVFLADADNSCIPAPFMIMNGVPIVKMDPKHPQFFNDGKTVIHADGVAVELTVQPSNNPLTMLGRVYAAINKIEEVFSPYKNKLFDHVSIVPTIKYDFKKWNEFGKSMVFANQFGCDRDWDAFHMTNDSPEVIDASTHPWRYGGGHWHMSGHPLFKEDPVLAICICAATMGLTGSAYSPDPVGEQQRANLYGRVGTFRPQLYKGAGEEKIYGIEYRKLSNAWADPKNSTLALAIIEATKMALSLFNRPEIGLMLVTAIQPELEDCIKYCDKNRCKELLAYVEAYC